IRLTFSATATPARRSSKPYWNGIRMALNTISFDPRWEHWHAAKARGRWPNEHFVRFVMKNYGAVPERSKVTFLDLGCGGCGNVRFLSEEGFNVVGVDASANALARAIELIPLGRLNVKLVQGDVTNDLGVGHDCFDCVVDVCTLQ